MRAARERDAIVEGGDWLGGCRREESLDGWTGKYSRIGDAGKQPRGNAEERNSMILLRARRLFWDS